MLSSIIKKKQLAAMWIYRVKFKVSHLKYLSRHQVLLRIIKSSQILIFTFKIIEAIFECNMLEAKTFSISQIFLISWAVMMLTSKLYKTIECLMKNLIHMVHQTILLYIIKIQNFNHLLRIINAAKIKLKINSNLLI